MTAAGYPETRRLELVEDHFGTPVPDPYRWLEDADSAEVAAWVEHQREFTDARLRDLPSRAWFGTVMDRIVARPRAGIPHRSGGRWLLSRNDGSQAQDVWYTADSLEELAAGGRVLLDPNAWSADGTVALGSLSVSNDGRMLAHTRAEAGSDWQHVHLSEFDGSEIDEPPVVGKFFVPTWLADNASYLYVTFEQAADARGDATTELGAARLMLHRLGSTDDELVWTCPEDPRTHAYPQVSHDGRYVVVTIVRGTENRNRLWVYPVTTDAGRAVLGEPRAVCPEPDAEYAFVAVLGDTLVLQTDLDAPRGRLVALDLADPASVLSELVPQAQDTLAGAAATRTELLVEYLEDASSVVRRFGHDGRPLGTLDLPRGALVGIDADPDHSDAFVGISTVTAPTAAFHVEAGRVRRLDLAGQGGLPAPAHRIERRRARSVDGTEVPYFLIVPEGTPEGPRPTLLYGYGGFKIPVLPDYRPGWTAWLAAGGVLAIANLRGGGEFGTAWYDDGRLGAKQHVFDDAIAVAEHLIATGVTTPAQLAVHGRSNGGLLVGAVMTQRPDLFAAALPTVGVLDLLRFHRFTIGAAWTSDYGDPDTEAGFAAAYAYSPLHHLRPGTTYPATLVCTADHDDRVVPLHSFKFAAALQHCQAGDAPCLLRVESSAGHGAGKPQRMIAAEWADVLAFAAEHTGLVPPGTDAG